jgi:rfaE bifunctional protein kinase chain/domain
MSAATTFSARCRGLRALVLGDVMVDAYLHGRVERISPEAPVPIVQVTDRSARLGGAANVALNLHALGAEPVVVGLTGNDDSGADLAGLLESQGLTAEGLITSDARRTTVKTRVIAGHQHVVRVDQETETPADARERTALLARMGDLIRRARPQVLVLQDYDKGVLTPETIDAVLTMAAEAGVPVAVDPKRQNFFAYRGVALFKPNLKELREGSKVELVPGDMAALRHAVDQLESRLGNRMTMVTLSEHGVYVKAGADDHHIAAHRRSIADVSGAGDTVIAVAAAAMAAGLDPHTMAAVANVAGGLVCEQVGVVPVDPARLDTECTRLQLLK